jgi:two-component system response regulator GlrR
MAHILIVEDKPSVRKLLSEHLTHEGFQVDSVCNAASIWEHITDSRPDLVLLDLYLNGCEGWGVLRDIESKYPRLPVMVLTAYDSFKNGPRLTQAELSIIDKVLFRLTDSSERRLHPV